MIRRAEECQHSTAERQDAQAVSFYSAILQLYGLENSCMMNRHGVALYVSPCVWRVWKEHSLAEVFEHFSMFLKRLQMEKFCGFGDAVVEIPLWLSSFWTVLIEKGIFFLDNVDPVTVMQNAEILSAMKNLLDDESLARWTSLVLSSCQVEQVNVFLLKLEFLFLILRFFLLKDVDWISLKAARDLSPVSDFHFFPPSFFFFFLKKAKSFVSFSFLCKILIN